MFKKILKLTTFIFLLICLTLSNSVINAGNSQSSTTETTQGVEGRVVAVELLLVFNNVVEAVTFLYLRMCLHEILTRLLEKYQCFL